MNLPLPLTGSLAGMRATRTGSWPVSGLKPKESNRMTWYHVTPSTAAALRSAKLRVIQPLESGDISNVAAGKLATTCDALKTLDDVHESAGC